MCVPDEADQQGKQCGEGSAVWQDGQIDTGDEDEVDEQQGIVESEKPEAGAAPGEQRGRVPSVRAGEQDGTCDACQTTQAVDQLTHASCPS